LVQGTRKERHTPLISVFSKEARVLEKGDEIVLRAAEYLEELYGNPEPPADIPRPWLDLGIWQTRSIDMKEWTNWIKGKRSTAPGLDGIQYNAVQALPESGKHLIINIINWMLVNKCVMGIIAARKGRIRDSLQCFTTGQGGGVAGRTIGEKALHSFGLI